MGRFALIIVSALIFSILTYSSGLRNAVFSSNVRVVETFGGHQAQNIAQSSMMIVLKDIMENGENSTFIPADNDQYVFPNDGFEVWNDISGFYRIHNISSGDILNIVASGQFEDQIYDARAELLRTNPIWNPEFISAVHSEGEITLGGSSKIIGHASTNSTAAGAVNLSSSTQIDSTLYIGPGGDPEVVVNYNGNIGNGIEVQGDKLEYPMPEFPEFPPKDTYGTSVYLSGSDSRTLQVSEYDGLYIPEIRIDDDTHLTIDLGNDARVLHVGNMDIIQGHVHLTGEGSLTVYIENSFTLEGSSRINYNGETKNYFTFYAGTTPLHFAGSTVYNGGLYAKTANITIIGSSSIQGHLITGGTDVYIFGDANANSRVVYAPNAHVEMAGSSVVYGAVISNSFLAKGTAKVEFNPEYDSDLSDLMLNQEVTYIIVSWN
ncbi:MAG: hypothetical protein WDZ38_00360 [Balneolaceae bacterium]